MSGRRRRRRSHSTQTLYRILAVLVGSCLFMLLAAVWVSTWLPFSFWTTLKLVVGVSVLVVINMLLQVTDHRR